MSPGARRAFLAVFLIGLVGLAAPSALGNKTKPQAGPLQLKLGGKQVIAVLGTQGCKFKIAVTSSNEAAVIATYSAEALGKHQVLLETVGIGESLVQIQTLEGTIAFCEGFDFGFPITVIADPTALPSQTKTKLKEASKFAKLAVKDYVADFNDTLADIIAAMNAGDLTPSGAAFEAIDAAQDLIDDLEDGQEFFLDDVYSDIWTRSLAFGATGIDAGNLGLLSGACGQWDDFEAGVRKLSGQAVSTMQKRLKSFLKLLDKAVGSEVDALFVLGAIPQLLFVPAQPIPVPAVEPLPPPDPPKRPLKQTWTASGRLSTSATSRLHVGGSADPSRGDVTIALAGPDGFTAEETVSLSPQDTWRVQFGNLPPGSHVVTLTQTENGPVSFTVTVP